MHRGFSRIYTRLPATDESQHLFVRSGYNGPFSQTVQSGERGLVWSVSGGTWAGAANYLNLDSQDATPQAHDKLYALSLRCLAI